MTLVKTSSFLLSALCQDQVLTPNRVLGSRLAGKMANRNKPPPLLSLSLSLSISPHIFLRSALHHRRADGAVPPSLLRPLEIFPKATAAMSERRRRRSEEAVAVIFRRRRQISLSGSESKWKKRPPPSSSSSSSSQCPARSFPSTSSASPAFVHSSTLRSLFLSLSLSLPLASFLMG